MKKPVQILLIEDNELDIRMIQHSASKTKLHNRITAVSEGMTALDRLRDCEQDELPDLILLDLSLPGFSGFSEIVQAIDGFIFEIVTLLDLSPAS